MKNSTNSITILKTFAKQLNAILEKDIRKFATNQNTNIKNAAFLQLISA